MVRIVLIRPGATEYDQQGRIQGVLDVPLSSEGASEAARAAGELSGSGIEIVYYSDCEHARQTAEAVSNRLGLKRKRLEHLQNLDHGLWQGMLVEEVKRKQPKVYRSWQEQPACVCPPGGETLGAAQQRVRAVIAKLLRKHKEGVVALIVPEPLASLVRAYLEQGEIGDLWRAGAEHGTWAFIDVEPRTLAHSG